MLFLFIDNDAYALHICPHAIAFSRGARVKEGASGNDFVNLHNAAIFSCNFNQFFIPPSLGVWRMMS